MKSQAALDLKDVIKAINFGDTKDLTIGDVKFAAAAVNTTVDGVTNTAGGDVYSGEFGQKLPQMQKQKAAFKKSEFFNGKDLTGWSASEHEVLVGQGRRYRGEFGSERTEERVHLVRR